MNELHELREIAADLVRNMPGPLSRVVVRRPPHELELEWFSTQAAPGAAPATTTEATEPLAAVAGQPDETPPAEGDVVVRAPVVGTFYYAPHPGAEPFVSVGSVVEPGQTLGIVEAMKLMNQITAESSGRIVRICVEDGGRVEFEQPLVVIESLDAERAA